MAGHACRRRSVSAVAPRLSDSSGAPSTSYTPVALQQEIQSLTTPVAPFGAAIVGTVEDLQAQSLIKVQHAQQAVSTTMDMLGMDLLEASLWLDSSMKARFLIERLLDESRQAVATASKSGNLRKARTGRK